MKLVMMTLEAAENSWLKLRRQVQTVTSPSYSSLN